MELFNKYVEEIQKDTKIDDFNIKQIQLMLPTRKHYWATKLLIHKKELNDLINQRKETINKLVLEVMEKSDVMLSRANAEKAVLKSKIIKDLDSQIDELGYVVELLEKAEQIFKGMSYDIKNIIEIQKLETL